MTDEDIPQKPMIPASAEKLAPLMTTKEIKEFASTLKTLMENIYEQIGTIPLHHWPKYQLTAASSHQEAYHWFVHLYRNGLASYLGEGQHVTRMRPGSNHYKECLVGFRDYIADRPELENLQRMIDAPLETNHLTTEKQAKAKECLAAFKQTVDHFCDKVNSMYPPEQRSAEIL